jgi:hypothetical protein
LFATETASIKDNREFSWKVGNAMHKLASAYLLIGLGFAACSNGLSSSGKSELHISGAQSQLACDSLSPAGQQELRAIVDSGSLSDLQWPKFANRSDSVKEFYEETGYDGDAESRRLKFDVALTVSGTRYSSDLHLGRVDPATLHKDFDPERHRHNPGEFLREETLAQLRAGKLTVRQTPGPKNALGLSKFIFLNDNNVYLHSTPAQTLSGKQRRDFGHGCIREQDPQGLAEWVLRNNPGWSKDGVAAAFKTEKEQRVNLTRIVPVLILYASAVAEEDGWVYFLEDIYGHDKSLVSLEAQAYSAHQ